MWPFAALPEPPRLYTLRWLDWRPFCTEGLRCSTAELTRGTRSEGNNSPSAGPQCGRVTGVVACCGLLGRAICAGRANTIELECTGVLRAVQSRAGWWAACHMTASLGQRFADGESVACGATASSVLHRSQSCGTAGRGVQRWDDDDQAAANLAEVAGGVLRLHLEDVVACG